MVERPACSRCLPPIASLPDTLHAVFLVSLAQLREELRETPHKAERQLDIDLPRSHVELNGTAVKSAAELRRQLPAMNAELLPTVLMFFTQAALALPYRRLMDLFSPWHLGERTPHTARRHARYEAHTQPGRLALCIHKEFRCFWLNQEGLDVTTHNVRLTVDIENLLDPQVEHVHLVIEVSGRR